MAAEPCKVAIVGAGAMAREHIRAFSDIPEARIAGIHSRTRARAESLATEMRVPLVCDSIEELYATTRAELVIVTVSVEAMHAIGLACLAYPWMVLLEKPPGMNMMEAREIRASAQAQGRRVFVALNRRFLSSTRAVLADLEHCNGSRFIHVQDQEDLEAAETAGVPLSVRQNWMYANSIHTIDYLRLFGRGRIASVTPILPWNPAVPQVVAAQVMFESGDIGLYQCIWRGPGPWTVSVSMAEKRWEMRPLEQAVYQNRGERRLNSVEVAAWDQAFKPGFRLQAEMAVAAAQGRQSELPTLDDALETMKVIQTVYSA